jgi:hypothetical protein
MMEIEAAPDQGTATEGQQGANGAEGGAAAAPDTDVASRLMEQFNTFTSDVTSRLDRFEQAQQPEEDEEDDDDLSQYALDPNDFSDDDFSDDGNLTPEAQQRAFVEMMRRVAKAELAPFEAQRAEERRVAEADALEEKYPELQEESVQDAMIEKVVAFAKQIGQPELAREPALLEMVYLAEKAKERAGDEIPAGSERTVRLQTGSTAPPAESREQTDDGDRIVSLANKSHYRIGT